MIFWIVDYSTITQAKVVLNTTIRTTAISIINYNIEHLETRMAQPTTYKTRKDSRLNMFYKKVNNKVFMMEMAVVRIVVFNTTLACVIVL
jgi:hypothetical protein